MQLSVSVERTGVMAPRIMEFDKAIGVNSSTIVPNCHILRSHEEVIFRVK